MSWYDFLILRFQDYKWWLFAPFTVCIAVGAILDLSDISIAVPTYIFLGLLIAWFIIWVVATIFYRHNLKQ